MMKSVGFFLAVFAVGLLSLVIVSGDLSRWWSGSREPGGLPAGDRSGEGGQEAASGAARKGAIEPNEIKIPVYDVVNGRLDFTFRGRLEESQLADLPDIQELDAITLRDGQLEVPIYDDLARDLPPGKDPGSRFFLLTFAAAEYQATRRPAGAGSNRRSEREREVVYLRGGGDRGIGRTDDGTELRFEELVFSIDRTGGAENPFLIRSEKPVDIRNGYLRLESPTGLEGRVVKDKGLQKLAFFPPVRTYLDPRAGELFSLSPGEKPEKKPAKKPEQGPKETGKVAITCAGPLTFRLEEEPRSIVFEKDVLIYPLEGPEPQPGIEPPAPGSTYFHCQLLTIEVDSSVSPPRPSRAVASWEGGRVRAHHEGKVVEGDRLVWSFPEAASRGEGVLTGKPALLDRDGRLETGQVVFLLDESRILLRGGLTGDFRTPEGGPEKGPERGPERGSARKGAAAGGTRSSRKTGKAPGPPVPAEPELPERWDFRAEEGELVFAPREPAAADPVPKPGKRTPVPPPVQPIGGRSLERFVARASRDEGVEIRSQDGGRYRLAGRTLLYDARARTVTMDGSDASGPRFHHGPDHGTARSIQLRIDEGLVALRGDVAVEIQDFEALAPPASRSAEGGGGAPVPAGASSAAGKGVRGPVELLAEELDLRFTSEETLLGAEARGMPGGAPASLRSLSPSSSWRLTGRSMRWDHAEGVATVGPVGPEAARPEEGGELPRLESEGGVLLARSIRFHQGAKRVFLEEGVLIQSRPGPEAGPEAGPAGERKDFELRAGRAEVDLADGPRPLPGGPSCGSREELGLARRIHAWGEEGGAIEIRSPRYRARGQEMTWDAASQELQLSGEGRQEVAWLEGDRESAVAAKTITYRCGEQVVLFTGQVEGEIHIDAPARSSPTPAPGDGEDGKREALRFHFETGEMKVKLREAGGKLSPVTMRARKGVFLRNDVEGLKLKGDDLLYDHDRNELRVFSEEGRFQTLTHSPPASPSGDGRPPDQPDRIDAREIRLWYRLPDGAARLPVGSKIESVIVKFRDNVNATFHGGSLDKLLPPSREGKEPKGEWTLRSDHLGLRLVPAEDRNRAVQVALAEGNVIFTHGEYMATGYEAFYEEARKKLTLRGKPARLIFANTPVSAGGTQEPGEIAISQIGETKLKWERTDSPRPERMGPDEIRRD